MGRLFIALLLCFLTGCAGYSDAWYPSYAGQPGWETTYYPPYYDNYYRSSAYSRREYKRSADAAELRYRNAAQERGDLRAVFNSVAGASKGGRDRYYWNRSDALSYKPISRGQGIYPSVPRSTFSHSRNSSRTSYQPRRSSRRHH
jgi:hypothetical protein